jgi:hypothetical protein
MDATVDVWTSKGADNAQQIVDDFESIMLTSSKPATKMKTGNVFGV